MIAKIRSYVCVVGVELASGTMPIRMVPVVRHAHISQGATMATCLSIVLLVRRASFLTTGTLGTGAPMVATC